MLDTLSAHDDAGKTYIKTVFSDICLITSANSGEGYVFSRFCVFVVSVFVSKITQKVVDGL